MKRLSITKIRYYRLRGCRIIRRKSLRIKKEQAGGDSASLFSNLSNEHKQYYGSTRTKVMGKPAMPL